MQILGPADDGARLSISSGGSFAVELAETPTTGFRWNIVELPPNLRVVEDAFQPPSSSTPGSPGSHRWTFEVAEAGTGQLRLQLRSRTPREGSQTEFTVHIEVAS